MSLASTRPLSPTVRRPHQPGGQADVRPRKRSSRHTPTARCVPAPAPARPTRFGARKAPRPLADPPTLRRKDPEFRCCVLRRHRAPTPPDPPVAARTPAPGQSHRQPRERRCWQGPGGAYAAHRAPGGGATRHLGGLIITVVCRVRTAATVPPAPPVAARPPAPGQSHRQPRESRCWQGPGGAYAAHRAPGGGSDPEYIRTGWQKSLLCKT